MWYSVDNKAPSAYALVRDSQCHRENTRNRDSACMPTMNRHVGSKALR